MHILALAFHTLSEMVRRKCISLKNLILKPFHAENIFHRHRYIVLTDIYRYLKIFIGTDKIFIDIEKQLFSYLFVNTFC